MSEPEKDLEDEAPESSETQDEGDSTETAKDAEVEESAATAEEASDEEGETSSADEQADAADESAANESPAGDEDASGEEESDDEESEPEISMGEGAADDEPASSAEGAGESAEPDGIIEVAYYGTTDVGLIREHNEDNLVMVDLEAEVRGLGEIDATRSTIVGERGLVLAVCDGMGGAAAGEVASQMAVDTIHEVMQAGGVPEDRDMFAHRLVFAIEEAGARIFAAAKMDRSRRGMGTTATVAGLVDEVLFIGQVGDSRCYLLRDGKLSLVTKDQSLVNQLIEAGQLTEEEAEAFEHSNIILQALGTTEDVAVDLTFVELRRGDRIMLCSDGLSGLVHAEMIQEVVAESDSLPDAARQLIELANAGGGHDNITCITATFDGDGLAAVDPSAPTPTYMQYPLPPPKVPAGHSQPPREPTIKTGIRKPGSDVKGAPLAYGTPDEDERSIMPLVFIGLLLAAAAAYYFFSSRSETPEPEVEDVVAEPVEEEEEDALFIVDIATDIAGGELFVNDESYGPLDTSADNAIELEAGAYQIEVRLGGSAIRSEMLTVEEDTRLELMLPVGAAGADEVEGEEAMEVELPTADGESEPAEEQGEPQDTPADEPAPPTMADMAAPTMSAPAMRETPMRPAAMAAPMDAPVMRPAAMRAPSMAPSMTDVPDNPF